MNDSALPQGQNPGDEPAASDTSDAGGLYAGYQKERESVSPPPPPQKTPKGYLQTILDAANHPFKNTARELSTIGRSVGLGLGRLGTAGATAISHITGGQSEEEKANIDRTNAELSAFYKHGEDDKTVEVGAAIATVAGATVLAVGGGAGVVVAGAAIDAFAFDPYKPGLAELLAKSPSPLRIPTMQGMVSVREGGEALSVHPSDSYPMALAKRAILGGAAGKVLDWGIRGVVLPAWKLLARGSDAAEVLASPHATAAEKQAATAEKASVDADLAAVRDGTYTPEGARVVSQPNGDGSWGPHEVNTGERFIGAAMRNPETGEFVSGAIHSDATDILRANGATGELERGYVTNQGRFVPEEEAFALTDGAVQSSKDVPTAPELNGKEFPPVASAKETTRAVEAQMAKANGKRAKLPLIGQQLRDEQALEAMASNGGAHTPRPFPGVAPAEETLAGVDAQMNRNGGATTVENERRALRMTREEAQSQSATMDEVVRGQEARNGRVIWTEEDVATHQDLVEQIRTAKSPEDAMAALHASDPFNLDTMSDINDFRLQQRALAAKFAGEFRALRQRVPVKVTLQLAEDFARKVGLAEWADRMRHLNSEDGLVESVKMALNSRAVEQAGERMGELSALRASRPHDPAVLMEMRRMGDIWYDLSMEVAGARSEWGRTGRIIQELRSDAARKISFRNDVKVITQGKSAVQEARAEVAKAQAVESAPAGAPATNGGAPKASAPAGEAKPRTSANDTDAVNASDFSLARARAAAKRVHNALKKAGSEYPEFEIDMEAAGKRAEKIRKEADAQRTDPLSPPTDAQKAAAEAEIAKRNPPVNPIQELSVWLDGAEKELDKVGQNASENAIKRDVAARQQAGTAFDSDLRQSETPVDAAKRAGKEAERQDRAFKKTHDVVNDPTPVEPRKPRADKVEKEPVLRIFADMEDWEVESWARLFQRSGGKVRNVQAVLATLKEESAAIVEREATKTTPQKVNEGIQNLFIQNLISGLKTAESIVTSGAAMNAFRAAGKILGGTVTADRFMLEEGAAQFYALARYAKENTASAAAAFSEARGIMDGAPRVYLQGGLTKTTIQLPGRIAGTLDEFTRVAAYRAEEFAKAFSQARQSGMDLASAARQAEGDVKFSFQQGIALNDQARELAGIPTLSDPLGHDTAMGLMAEGLAKLPLGKLVVPFMRPSVNTFRFFAQNTPGLNLFNAQARKIMAEGGSEAVQLHARSVIAGSMMGYTVSEFINGNITGDGPSDPTLRKLWEEDHQAYSWKINGQWVSYRRLEPFASWIGLVADASEAYMEVDEDGNHGDVMFAVFSAMVKNTYNKSWTQGLSEKLTAWAHADYNSLARVGGGLAEGLLIPQAVQQANDDPYYREARGIVDNLRANTPGLSSTLPPKFDWDGKPSMKQNVLWNNLSMFPMKSAKTSFVADELVKNNIKIKPYPARQFKNQFDMLDPKYEKNGKLPYVRFMEILASKDIRGQMERLMKSPAWDKMAPGTPTYPGGDREREIKSIKDAAESDALDQVFKEWGGTTLAQDYDRIRYDLPDAARGGPRA
jgi:hypothetical protein